MDKEPHTPHAPDADRCADIQGVLFEYMTRELGHARSALVREHLRRCPDCQRMAAEIQATLDALREDVPAADASPPRLTDERRRQLAWSITHPVRDWIHRHHVMVSIIVALIVLAVIAGVLRKVVIVRQDEPVGPPVTIGQGEPPHESEPPP
ncbi:MAG: zf-HC2 domain-containing protein [Lentisphaerae bacterium]|nr:zf-HC2 domain-containing protein [Lentisphaerota bacterium]